MADAVVGVQSTISPRIFDLIQEDAGFRATWEENLENRLAVELHRRRMYPRGEPRLVDPIFLKVVYRWSERDQEWYADSVGCAKDEADEVVVLFETEASPYPA